MKYVGIYLIGVLGVSQGEPTAIARMLEDLCTCCETESRHELNLNLDPPAW